jgi:S1-C subfamily serine protease
MRGLFVALVVLCASLSSARAEMIAKYPFPGLWAGGAYADNTTNQFSNCAAAAEYLNGVTLLVSFTFDYRWVIGLVGPDWNLSVREATVSYRFDDMVWRRGTASVDSPQFMTLEMPDDQHVLDLFRRSRTMDVSFLGGDYHFDLSGTSKLAIALAQCVGTHTNTPPPATTAATGPTPAEEEPRDSSGTGIVVSTSGYVLTNHHVIDGCASFSVTASGSAPKPATVIRFDPANDLALLKVDEPLSAAAATFRTGTPLQAGETVAVYGFPLTGMLSQSGNIVSGNITALSGLADDVRFVQISAPIQLGNSGGPLVDAAGLVVGMVNAKMDDVAVLGATGSLPQNVNFAIKGSVVMSFLDAHSIPYQTSSSAAPLTLVDIAAQTKRFGVLVSCSSGT